MRQMVAGLVVVLALGSLASCGHINFRILGKQETVLILLRTDASGACVLQQKTPQEIRTDAGSVVRWMFVGACQGGPKIGIRQTVMKDGRPHELFDLSDPGTKLEETAPATPGPPVTLSAKMKQNLEKGHYSYQVLINGRPAEYNSPADEGSFFACPVWPCGDFDRDYY
jgi:hypothetical protein